ncbi:hypothetical protein MNV49_002228 [Pseudohyphozyma bogoriensis]|nr:hypothetical protein MNV49_002228 [Pseudohyphozyma bogoriensis]
MPSCNPPPPSSNDPLTAEYAASEDFTDADAVALFPDPSPVNSYTTPLSAPIVIPQLDDDFDAPFFRAYPTQIGSISEEDWAKFIDGLNLALIASPPLQVLNKAGMVVSFVPSLACVLVGIGVQVSTKIAMKTLSKTLTDRYLAYTNETIFAPRGLRVHICKTPIMRQVIGLDPIPVTSDFSSPDSKKPSKMKTFGKGAGKAAQGVGLKIPVVKSIVNAASNKAPAVEWSGLTASERRIKELEGHVMPVSLDLPPPTTPAGLYDKTSNLSVKFRQQSTAKSSREHERRRAILAVKNGSTDPDTIAASKAPKSTFVGTVVDGASTMFAGDKKENGYGEKVDGWIGSVTAARSGLRGGLLGGGLLGQIASRRTGSSGEAQAGSGGALGGMLRGSEKEDVEIANRQERNTTKKLLWLVVVDLETEFVGDYEGN